MDEYLDKEPAKIVDRRSNVTVNTQQPLPSGMSATTHATNDSSMHHQKKRKSSLCKTSDANFSRQPPTCSQGGSKDTVTIALPSGDGADERPPVNNPVLESDIKEIRRLLKNYIVRLENKDAMAKNSKDWRLVARVMDRLFFFSYIGTIIVSLMTAFPKDVPDTWVLPEAAGSTAGPLDVTNGEANYLVS